MVRGAPVIVKVGDDTVLTGRIDGVRRTVARGGVTLSLSGWDNAAVLVDCAAPILTARQMELPDVVAQIVRQLGITKIRIESEGTLRSNKISAGPGERAWDMLLRACAARGLWPWFAPDGTLVIGGLDYTKPTVASVIMRMDGKGNNVLSLSDASSIDKSFSELAVLAQSHAHSSTKQSAIIDVVDDADSDIGLSTGVAETGQHGMKAVVKDPTVSYYRPQVMVVGDADNQEQINYHARKALSDARLSGYSLTAIVHGHRTSDGVLWEPGQRIHVISEYHGIDAVYFLMGREFNGGRPNGTTTTLRLKEDCVWIPDAYPKKKNSASAKVKGRQSLSMWPDIERRINGVLNRIRLAFRTRLTRVNSNGPLQTFQAKGLAGESLQDSELFQHYDFTSNPLPGTMAIVLPLGGLTSHSIVIATEHATYRLQALKPGEVALYTDEGARIVLKCGRLIETDCDEFRVNCKQFVVNAKEKADFNTPMVTAREQVTAQGKITSNGGLAIKGGNSASFTGNVTQTGGSYSTDGDVIAGKISLTYHGHDGDSGGKTGRQSLLTTEPLPLPLLCPCCILAAWIIY